MARGIVFAALAAGLFAGSVSAQPDAPALYSKAARGFWLTSGVQQPTAEMTCSPPPEGGYATVSLTVNGAASRLGPKPTTIEIARALLFGTTTEYAYREGTSDTFHSTESSNVFDYNPLSWSDEMLSYDYVGFETSSTTTSTTTTTESNTHTTTTTDESTFDSTTNTTDFGDGTTRYTWYKNYTINGSPPVRRQNQNHYSGVYYSDAEDLMDWEISNTTSDSSADYITRGTYRLWDLLTPLALHASVRKVQVPLRPSVLAGVLINAECTLNGEPLADLNTPLDASFVECNSPEYIYSSDSSTTYSDATDTSTTYSSDVVVKETQDNNITRTEFYYTARNLCTAQLVCNNLPINTHVNGYGQNKANKDATAYLNFGGYACPTGYLIKCDAAANRMVAATDGSGCVAAPGWAWADMNGNAVDPTGVQSAYMCNPVGTQLAAPSAGGCQCLTGYTGLTCEACTDGFLSTKVLIGDGVHSLTALAELYPGNNIANGAGSGQELYPKIGDPERAGDADYGVFLPSAFSDYHIHNDYKYTPGNPGSFCVRDPNA